MARPRPVRWAIAPIRQAIMAALWPVEQRLLPGTDAPAYPPVFIIGVPRSGTTLFFQVLTSALTFAYISNLAHRLYRTPVAASWLGRQMIRHFTGDYSSRYGHIAGWGAPSEGGWIWNRWCPPFGYADEQSVTERIARRMRATIGGIARVMDAPFISKNAVHSVQVRLLNRVFPGGCFLMVLREPIYTIQSLIRARRDRLRREGVPLDRWMSVQPRAVRELRNEGLVAQVCGQVYQIECEAYNDLTEIAPQRCLAVDYDALCADPARVVADCRDFLATQGIPTVERRPIVDAFTPSRPVTLEDQLRDEVHARIRQLWGSHDPWRTENRLPFITPRSEPLMTG